MYQVFNVTTGEAMPVLSETPYELAGPLAERMTAQKTDEDGNLLYLDWPGRETTEECADFQLDPESQEVEWKDYQPVMIDGDPLYEWRPIVPTDAEVLSEAKRAKLAEIKSLISATDYKCLKFVDGALTAEEYAETKAYRESLRDAYNAVEAAASVSEVESIEL